MKTFNKRYELHGEYYHRFTTCTKCGLEFRDKAWQKHKDGNDPWWDFDGTIFCPKCCESMCDECGSMNLEYYDDGREDGYPDNILCKGCGHWPQ